MASRKASKRKQDQTTHPAAKVFEAAKRREKVTLSIPETRALAQFIQYLALRVGKAEGWTADQTEDALKDGKVSE